MNKKTQSLLESLLELSPDVDTSAVIESRGINVIASAIQLLEAVYDIYGEEAAMEMEKRLCSSIKRRNDVKFIRGIRSLNL